MSYILDALRKADADRERDPARGIHAQPVAPTEPAWRPPPAWLAAGGIAVLALAAAYGWLVRTAPVASPPVAIATGAPAASLVAPVPAPVAVVKPQAAAPAVVVPVVAEQVTPPAPPALLPAVERATAKHAVAAAVAKVPVAAITPARQAPAAPIAGPAAAAAAAPAPAPATPAPTAPGDRVFAVAELPADVQRELPKLQISGGVHSENAAQRMLIVGGQVMNEGAELAPGVVLEQIRARTAVLKFRGYRYSVMY